MKKLLSLDRAILLILAIYFIIINLLVLNRFWQFEAFYYDHGIFDSALWQVAHFTTPLIDHLEPQLIRHFGDHFTPSFYLLAPVYWFTSPYEPILVIQNLLVTATAYILFLIAKDKIKNKLMIFSLIISFLGYIGLQNFLISNLHSESVAMFAIALTIFALEKKRKFVYWFGILILLGSKQYFSSIALAIGIYAFFTDRKKLGLLTSIISISYYVAVTKLVMPAIGQHNYLYTVQLPNPNHIIEDLSLPIIKTETILVSLLTFGFLPIFAIPFWPAIFQDFFGRFVLSSSARWDLGLHYSATLSVILTCAAILGTSYLEKNQIYKKIESIHAISILLIVIFLHRFVYHGPLGLVTNLTFYKQTQNHNFLREFLKKIPQNKMVMTNNNLATYLTHTNTVILLRGNYEDWQPEIIALDLRPGQNPNNFWPMNEVAARQLFTNLSLDPKYSLIYTNGTQSIFQRTTL